MRILNSDAVAAALSHSDCIVALEAAMKAVSEGKTVMPLRQYMGIPGGDGKFTLMPGYLDDPASFGVKIISKFPREAGSPHGSHVGAVVVFDAKQGIPLAILDAAETTAIRTASARALATRMLSRENSKVLAILGTGTEALHHAKALVCVRDIEEISIWGRTPANANALVTEIKKEFKSKVSVFGEVEEAVGNADIVCTTTSAKEPILKGEWLPQGCHVNLVGAAIISAAEADDEVVTRSRFYVDSRASAMAQAGELKSAIDAGLVTEEHILAEIGELLSEPEKGRLSEEDITVYKSLGVVAQDLVAGLRAYDSAVDSNIGMELDW